MPSRRLASALFVLVAACSSPGGGGVLLPAPDTAVADGVLFPDVAGLDTASTDSAADTEPADTEPGPDTAPPVDTELAPDTVPPVDTEPAPDTLPPVDTEPAPDTAAPPDAVVLFCKSGDPCNDQDPCTVNDRCEDNVCVGDALSCDDSVPCTADACDGGLCTHDVLADYCLIGGICWTAGQPNPANACLACTPTAAAAAWSPLDGAACSDGDPCTEGEACAAGTCSGGAPPAEVCDDGADNDCDGRTDASDESCGGATPCTHHVDCYPARLCARWATSGASVCSEPCLGPSDCGPGQACSKLPGSAQVGFCQAAAAEALPEGAPCALDSDCASLLCADDVCRATCLSESRCTAPGYTCHPVGNLDVGVISGACAPNPPGSLAVGQICQQSGYFDSQFCASGHCDLMPYPSEILPCRELCHSETACAPTQECNVVLYAPGENADAMPFSPNYTALSHDALTACYTPAHPGGSLPVGAVCAQTQKWQCASNKCFPLSPDDPQTYCSSYCEFDAECPSGMICKADMVNLASDWLQNAWISAQAPAPGAYTLVRVCKWE